MKTITATIVNVLGGYEVRITADGKNAGVAMSKMMGEQAIYDDALIQLNSIWCPSLKGLTAKAALAVAGVSETDCDLISAMPDKN